MKIITEDDPDFARLRELRNRVFKPDTRCLWGGPDIEPEPPFVDPAWKGILLPTSIGSWESGMDPAPGMLHIRSNTVEWFDGFPRRDGLPELRSWTDPLIWCLEKRDADCLVLTNDSIPAEDYESLHDRPPSYGVVTPDNKGIDDGFNEFVRLFGKSIQDQPILMFDPSGDWGLADFEEADFLVGATPKFYDQYCEVAGGEHFVKAWYYFYCITDMISGPHDYGSEHYFSMTDWSSYFIDLHIFEFKRPIDWAAEFGDKIKGHDEGEPVEGWPWSD